MSNSELPKGWKKCNLSYVLSSNLNSIGKNYPYQEIKYLDTGSITNNKIESFQSFDIKDAPSRAKRLVKHQNIIYSTVRPIQRHFGFIENPQENLVVSTGFSVLHIHENLASPKFIYYFLSSNDIVEELDAIAEGATSAYPSLKPSDIESLEINLPPLAEQKAIAEVLSSLDDKIDLLHQQNQTLEDMAQTLFREWFVEKADEGWEEVKLGDYVNCINGYTYKSIELMESRNALVTLKNFARDGSLRLDGFKEFTGIKFKEAQVVTDGDLVVAHTDITQNADIIGNPILVKNIHNYDKLVITMDLVKVEPFVNWIKKSYLYCLWAPLKTTLEFNL